MKKSEIQFHRDGYGPAHPAINVKCRDFARGLTAEKLGCEQGVFETAAQFAFESAQEQFWNGAEEEVKTLFPGAHMYSEGRSSGWLAVHGLPAVETWDAVMVSRWARLVKFCARKIEYQSRADVVAENIVANEWNKRGAEAYNFIDRKDGGRECIAALKAAAIAAGFGAVVRA